MSAGKTVGGQFGSSYPQYLDPGEGLAFEPFEEGAARGRHIGETVRDARLVEGGDRVAPAADRDELAGLREFGRRLRDLDCADVEGLLLEGAERAVPHQRLRRRQDRDDVLDAARTDVEDHVAG